MAKANNACPTAQAIVNGGRTGRALMTRNLNISGIRVFLHTRMKEVTSSSSWDGGFPSSSGLRTKGGRMTLLASVTQENTTRAIDPIRAIWPTVSVTSDSSSSVGSPF
jgi:hypothetical protein